MPEFLCPTDRRHPLEVDAALSRFNTSFNGNLICNEGHEFIVSRNVIDLLPDSRFPGGSVANFSNHISITASGYEKWRKRSISKLSGQDFSLQDEATLMLSWIGRRRGETILDVGTSTGFYARSIAEANPANDTFALDISMPMLNEAVNKAKISGVGFYPVRADAAKLPFFDDQVDVIVCGGTYNELHEPENVLREMRRVLKPGGVCFMMYLTRSASYTGRIIQASLAPGGIHFPKRKIIEQLLYDTGFESRKQRQMGIVTFELLR